MTSSSLINQSDSAHPASTTNPNSSTSHSQTALKVRIDRIQYGEDLNRSPMASIIIPTLDGQRQGLLQELMADLKNQSLARFELLLIVGDNRQGRAINRGVQESQAEYIFTMDDDTVIGTPKLLENLLQVLRDEPKVGMVGASTVLPVNCSWFQRVASKQIPRRLFPVVERLIDSDMVQHPCLAMPKALFLQLGGEDEELKRGLDPLLRHKVRAAGYRVAIAPHSYISHLLPESYLAVVRMYFRNGRGSAFAQRHYPDRVFNLSDGFQKNQFPSKVPFAKRASSYPLRLLGSFLAGKWIKLSVEASYVGGFLTEYLFGKSDPRKS